MNLGLAILGEGSLPPRLREQVIMLVAGRCRCPYEAAQHEPIALDAGVTPEQLSAIASGRLDAALFHDAELAALRAARELSPSTPGRPRPSPPLRRHHTHEQIVELTLTVGYYTMLAGLMNGLDIDIDPVGDRFSLLPNRR